MEPVTITVKVTLTPPDTSVADSEEVRRDLEQAIADIGEFWVDTEVSGQDDETSEPWTVDEVTVIE